MTTYRVTLTFLESLLGTVRNRMSRMSKKWDSVMEALGYLYEQYYGGGQIADAIKYLMWAYAKWLDDGEESDANEDKAAFDPAS